MSKELPTISVCAIVKNEEANIKDFIDNIKDFADEIVIIDTGSTDQTVEIIQKIKEKAKLNIIFDKYIYSGEFHFGKARNYSLKKANMDYIVLLDADNRVSDKFRKEIKNFLKREKPVVSVVKRIDELLPNLIEYPEMIIKNYQSIFYGENEKARIHEKLIHNYKVKIFDSPVWHCQRETHPLYSPQRILPRTKLEIDRTPKTGGFVRHFLKGIIAFWYKFKKTYFRKKLYKDGWAGFKYAFIRGLYGFLIHLFVGLKPKKGYKYWEDFRFKNRYKIND